MNRHVLELPDVSPSKAIDGTRWFASGAAVASRRPTGGIRIGVQAYAADEALDLIAVILAAAGIQPADADEPAAADDEDAYPLGQVRG